MLGVALLASVFSSECGRRWGSAHHSLSAGDYAGNHLVEVCFGPPSSCCIFQCPWLSPLPQVLGSILSKQPQPLVGLGTAAVLHAVL